MKKLFRTLVVLTFASAAFLTSCKEDSDIADVTVEIIASPSTDPVALGTNLTLTLELKGNDDNKLKSVTLTSTKLGAPLLNNKELSGTSANEVVKVVLDQIGTWSFTVTLTGEEGDPQTKTYQVTVSAPSSYKALDVGLNEFPMGAQASSISQFVNLVNAEIYAFGSGAAKSNSAQIDLGYAYATSPSTNAATLFGPSHTAYNDAIYNTPAEFALKTWTVRNATKIVRLTNLTAANWEDYSTDSVLIANAGKLANASENRVTKLAIGDVLMFETGRNIGGTPKKGLIVVTAVNTSPTGSQGDIKIKRSIEQ